MSYYHQNEAVQMRNTQDEDIFNKLNKIDFTTVSLNNLNTGDTFDVVAIRYLKTKYGERYYMLTEKEGDIYQSNKNMYNDIKKYLKNEKEMTNIYLKNKITSHYFRRDDFEPFINVVIGKESKFNEYDYKEISYTFA